jgi:hypothetical protein
MICFYFLGLHKWPHGPSGVLHGAPRGSFMTLVYFHVSTLQTSQHDAAHLGLSGPLPCSLSFWILTSPQQEHHGSLLEGK